MRIPINQNIGRWYVAIPIPNSFSEYSKIASSLGFFVYPQFMDNFFISQKGKADVIRFLRELNKHKNQVLFAVYPDYRYDLTCLLKNYKVNWIFPMHRKAEEDFILKNDFDFIGFPYDKPRRDYNIHYFINFTNKYGLKRWYLGYFYRAKEKEYILFHFDGFDTTMIQHHVQKRAKVWQSWKASIQVYDKNKIELFKESLEKFKRDLLNLSTTDIKLLQ